MWISALKPTMNHYVELMEELYDTECLDEECTQFDVEVEVNKEGQTEVVRMVKHSATFSEKRTEVTVDDHYFSEPGSKYFLHIKAIGKIGRFIIVEEENNFSIEEE
ncbi:hypothetical protein ACLIA0_09945 [Bacillaceae bacterium W0354]